MDGTPHDEWPIHRLAQVSAVSVAYFAREFKKAFGVPPHRYLLTRRIERATTLLRDTDLPITEIALQTGWTSLGTLGASSVTSPVEARESFERASGRFRMWGSISPSASCAMYNGQTSKSQFWRSGE
jgi:AraC-like DNA-binding protein